MPRLSKKPRRIWLCIVLILIGIAPLVSVALAGLIADLNGCKLHKGFVQPCVVFGSDIGGLLYTMTIMGWLMLISLLFLAGGVLGLVGEGLRLIVRRLRARLP